MARGEFTRFPKSIWLHPGRGEPAQGKAVDAGDA